MSSTKHTGRSDVEKEAVRLARKRLPVPETFTERVHEDDLTVGARNGYYMACADLLPIQYQRDATIATLLEQNTELLEALKLVCNGIEQSHNDNVVGASMRASVPTLRAIIAKCEAQNA